LNVVDVKVTVERLHEQIGLGASSGQVVGMDDDQEVRRGTRRSRCVMARERNAKREQSVSEHSWPLEGSGITTTTISRRWDLRLVHAAIGAPHSQSAPAGDFEHRRGLRAGLFEASMEAEGTERIVCLIGPLTIASQIDRSAIISRHAIDFVKREKEKPVPRPTVG